MGAVDPASFAVPGPFTALTGATAVAVAELAEDPVVLCRVAQGLLVDPDDPSGDSLAPDRLAERNVRSAQDLLERVLHRDPTPLDQPRRPEQRVAGTCRHFAVLTTALLRAHGVPARARCGFASYFVPERWVDHWITERWCDAERRWVRVDPEAIDLGLVPDPFDLAPTHFQSGSEAWLAVRTGRTDARAYGVAGTDNWGPGEIRGNALRDLAALQRIEVLPWDEWDPMAASYAGTAGAAFDAEIDALALATAAGDDALLAEFAHRYPVPSAILA
ncbi:MAG: transglutaminase [Ilumatobacteraceae bacterium]|nr:transglutaminase [Ilumatobacteraceae bacterium]